MTDIPEVVSRTAHRLKKRPISWHKAHGGFTPAQRLLVTWADDTSCFIKAPPDPESSHSDRVHEIADYLRTEFRIYSQLRGEFLAGLIDWSDDDGFPILVLENLSQGFWPPPWTSDRVNAVLRTLDVVHNQQMPGLPSIDSWYGDRLRVGWQEVETDPEPFVSLGLSTRTWLDRSLPTLVAAANEAEFNGTSLMHNDIRSDNLCLIGERVVLVDWNLACYGNANLDTAFWLPSLQAEGGPAPNEIMPSAPELAAVVSGFFAARAGLAMIPDASRVRDVQLQQLKTALPWAVRALNLPPLDGNAAAAS